MAVLLITQSTAVHESVVPRCAAVGAEADVCADPAASLRAWRGAELVLVGAEVAADLAALAPPRRGGVHVVGFTPDDAAFRAAVELGASSVVDLAEATDALADLIAEVDDAGSSGRIVGIVGGAGGAGATTLAVALAQANAVREGGSPTLVVDTDPLGPGLDILLGLEGAPGVRWEGLAQTSGRLGGRALRDGVPRRDSLGVLTWSGVRRELDVPTVRRVLPSAARGHDLVVLDLARHSSAPLVELVERCDDLLVVTPARVPALASTARLVAGLACEGRAGLVLRPGGLSDADAERVTGLPVVAAIADQRGVSDALDRGVGPLAGRGPLARAARGLLEAA